MSGCKFGDYGQRFVLLGSLPRSFSMFGCGLTPVFFTTVSDFL